MQLFLQPAGRERGALNYDKTVRRKWRLEDLLRVPGLTESDQNELRSLLGENEVGIWGVKRGHAPEAHWKKMMKGDIILFYRDGKYVSQARALGTFISDTLSRWLWGEDEGRGVWSNLYFFTDSEDVVVPRQDVNRLLRYNDLNFSPQGLTRVKDDNAVGILGIPKFLKGVTPESISDIHAKTHQRDSKEHTLTKGAVEDAILISQKIFELFPVGKIPNVGEQASPNLNIYRENIKPLLDTYTDDYGKTPSSLISATLNSFFIRAGLSREAYGIYARAHYGGSEILRYTWGCIFKKNNNSLPYSYSPQLFIIINRYGIQIGFGYGFSVRDEDEAVSTIKNSPDANTILSEALSNQPEIRFYRETRPDEPPRSQDIVQPATPENIASNWSKSAIACAFFDRGSLPVDIRTAIIGVLNGLLPLFSASLGDSHLASLAQTPLPKEETEDEDQEDAPAPRGSYADFKDELAVDFGDKIVLDSKLVFEDQDRILHQISEALKNKKHIMLMGPPGTGKSKLAAAVCDSLIGKSERKGWKLCTASSDWSPYETIGGYRQEPNLELQFYPGIFLSCFQDEDDMPINEWLVIDEINRADIDKAFGPLFSALTGQDVVLPYAKGDGRVVLFANFKGDGNPKVKPNIYIIPPDWRMIATMNTIDKASLYEMSYAFMRRFAFIMVDVPKDPNSQLMARYASSWGINFSDPSRTFQCICSIWQAVCRYRKIGPAIIEDMCRHLASSGGEDRPEAYQDAFLMYIMPQLEGLDERQHTELLNTLLSMECLRSGDSLFEKTYREFFGLKQKEAV